jgi:hypothetical protein
MTTHLEASNTTSTTTPLTTSLTSSSPPTVPASGKLFIAYICNKIIRHPTKNYIYM